MAIEESELREALDSVDIQRVMLEDELLTQEEWIPAMYRNGQSLSLDIETTVEGLTERELVMWKLGRVEERARVLEEISDDLLNGEFEME